MVLINNLSWSGLSLCKSVTWTELFKMTPRSMELFHQSPPLNKLNSAMYTVNINWSSIFSRAVRTLNFFYLIDPLQLIFRVDKLFKNLILNIRCVNCIFLSWEFHYIFMLCFIYILHIYILYLYLVNWSFHH